MTPAAVSLGFGTKPFQHSFTDTIEIWLHYLRYWIWVGVGYLWGFWLLLTGLTVLVLKYMDPEKSRPSIDDGASAAEQMTMQQRVTKAVSLKQLGNSESRCSSSRAHS